MIFMQTLSIELSQILRREFNNIWYAKTNVH